MTEAHTTRERRYSKCDHCNVAVANAVGTNSETKCAKLELNFITSKSRKKNIQRNLRKIQQDMRT